MNAYGGGETETFARANEPPPTDRIIIEVVEDVL
jgi:hypothetical protein